MTQPEHTSEVGPYWQEGVVEQFEGKEAVIRLADGQAIRWAIKNLPDDLEIGASIRILIRTKKTEAEEREALAKTILNEILKSESSS